MTSPAPSVGDWYRFAGGDLFEIVAFDDEDGTIELQYFDGTIEEIELDDWTERWSAGGIEEAAPPEDWTGSLDVDQPANDTEPEDGFDSGRVDDGIHSRRLDS